LIVRMTVLKLLIYRGSYPLCVPILLKKYIASDKEYKQT